jgi:potassium-dependent mechanosensitive channel
MGFKQTLQIGFYVFMSVLWISAVTQQVVWPQAFAWLTALCLVGVGGVLFYGINKLYSILFHHPSFAPRFMYYFGYTPAQSFSECWILKIVLQCVIVIGTFYLVVQQFNATQPVLQVLDDSVIHGVKLANSVIYPTKIVAGIVVFCALYLMCRRLSAKLSRKEAFEKEKEAQVAILSVLTYIGFALALLSGLWTAGFDFTGLTVVAGALSVGIGLGLQGIVNNFVSGLVLLIEKPIKPGDRIIIDGIEGIVKKIRVRSTQLSTLQREDVMIPNSHFITRPITNTMYTDKHVLIKCQVSVPYGSDPQLVRSLLLSVAMEHNDVLKNTQAQQPVVLFKEFSHNALIFQLCSVIKDVNKKAVVQSDLNFAIESCFRKNGIELSIPYAYDHQQDKCT